jgi:hypothetical protein
MSAVAALPVRRSLHSLRLYSLVYLASPYASFPAGPELAFKDAAALNARLLKAGIRSFSPIVHGHPIAHLGGIDPLDHSIWLPFDEAMMHAAQALVIAEMEGWQASKGIAHEMEVFQRLGKPFYFIDPNTLEVK